MCVMGGGAGVSPQEHHPPQRGWGHVILSLPHSTFTYIYVYTLLIKYIYLYVYLLMCASLIAQLVNNEPAMQETPIGFLGWEDPLEKG